MTTPHPTLARFDAVRASEARLAMATLVSLLFLFGKFVKR